MCDSGADSPASNNDECKSVSTEDAEGEQLDKFSGFLKSL